METLSFIRILVLLAAAGLFFIFSRRISKSLLHGYVLVGVGLSLVVLNLFIGALFHGTLLPEEWRDRSFPIVGFISGYVGQTLGLVLLLVGTYRLVRSLEPLLAEHYSSLVEHSLAGVYLIQDGVFKFVNPRLAEIFGYERKELLGKSFVDLVAPQSRDLVTENVRKRVTGAMQSINYQFIGRRKNGESFDVEVYGSRTIYKGKPAVHGTLLDITERKRAEEALQASERRLRESLAFQQRLIASLPTISFITTDLNAIVTSFSPGAEQIFGYGAEEMIGQPVAKLHLPEDVAKFPEIIRAQIEGRIGFNGGITLVRKNGERFPAQFITSAILDEEGKVVALLGVSQDITERKLAQQQLQQRIEQLQAIYHLSNTVSHAEAIEEIYQEALNSLQRTLKADRSSVLLFDPDGVIRFKAWRGLSEGYRKAVQGHTRWSPNEKNPQPILIANVKEEQSLEALRAVIVGEGIHALGFIPLMYEDRLLGKFMIYYNLPHRFGEEEIQLAQTIASHVAFAIARQQAEEALAQSERKFKDLVQSIDAIVWEADAITFQFYFVSDQAKKLLGYPVEQWLNTPTFWADHVHPDDREQAINYCVRSTHATVNHEFEYRMIAADGRIVWLRDLVTVESVNNEPRRLRGVMIDITDRKRAEEQLRKLSRAIEQSPSSMVITDTAGNIEYVNPKFTQITGYTLEEVIGKNPSILKSGKTPAEEYKRLWDTITSGGEWRGEFYNQKKNGEHYWVFTSISPITNAKGVITHFLAAEEDITERKQAEEERRQFEAQIQHAQKLESLGVLAGGIAHDFNNLLVGILGNAGLALAELSPESPARDTIQQIETAGQRAAELVKQMLAYSGKGHFLVKRLNLNAIVEEMTHLLQVSISKHVVLRYNFVRNLPAVEADATQIRQVVMNLVVNASEAIGEKTGVITISTGAVHADCAYLTETYLAPELSAGDYVYLEVADTGCGMDAETQAKIFDPFFTTKFTGRGLGLAAVLGIVRGHKGALKVYSEPGCGTTFKILLPCVEASAKSLSAENQTTAAWHLPAPAGGCSTVLVVDDEETVRTVTARMLKHFGFTVLLAADGRTGIEAFRAHADEIACVLLDRTMPYPNGEEVFHEIRRLKRDARVILMSGFNEPEATDRFAGKGLAGFLQKPYTPQDLREKLQSVLEEK